MFSQPGKNDCQPTLIHVIHLRVFFFCKFLHVFPFYFEFPVKGFILTLLDSRIPGLYLMFRTGRLARADNNKRITWTCESGVCKFM